jgi:hypothetical protein
VSFLVAVRRSSVETNKQVTMRKTRFTAAATAALALGLLAPSVALAQPGAPPPPPPPGAGGGGGGYYAQPTGPQHFDRRGFTIGVGFGVGGMASDSGILEDCFDCDYEPASVGFDVHLGGMINPRLALLGEIWGMGQSVDAYGSTTLVQTLVMFAAQYWVTPQLWLKGGIGAANLSYSYDTGSDVVSEDIDAGAALMGAVGYEVMSSPRFALDLQLRLGSGSYDGINEQVSVGMLGLGLNWY